MISILGSTHSVSHWTHKMVKWPGVVGVGNEIDEMISIMVLLKTSSKYKLKIKQNKKQFQSSKKQKVGTLFPVIYISENGNESDDV